MENELVIGVIVTAGGVLTGAVGKMWTMFTSELKDCKEDRKALHLKTEEMHDEIREISTEVGKLKGHLEALQSSPGAANNSPSPRN